jgi:hypothetical protein
MIYLVTSIEIRRDGLVGVAVVEALTMASVSLPYVPTLMFFNEKYFDHV